MMPRMTGERARPRALRPQRELDGVPVLVLTARADDALRVQLLREGAQDYLMKPFVAEEVRARVANLVAVKRAREVLQRERRDADARRRRARRGGRGAQARARVPRSR